MRSSLLTLDFSRSFLDEEKPRSFYAGRAHSDIPTRALFTLSLDSSRSFLDDEKPRDLSIVYEARCREQLSKDGANNKLHTKVINLSYLSYNNTHTI